MGRRVLVTGAARSTGRRLVGALAEEPEVELVVAVDEQEPAEPFPDKVERLVVDRMCLRGPTQLVQPDRQVAGLGKREPTRRRPPCLP